MACTVVVFLIAKLNAPVASGESISASDVAQGAGSISTTERNDALIQLVKDAWKVKEMPDMYLWVSQAQPIIERILGKDSASQMLSAIPKSEQEAMGNFKRVPIDKAAPTLAQALLQPAMIFLEEKIVPEYVEPKLDLVMTCESSGRGTDHVIFQPVRLTNKSDEKMLLSFRLHYKTPYDPPNHAPWSTYGEWHDWKTGSYRDTPGSDVVDVASKGQVKGHLVFKIDESQIQHQLQSGKDIEVVGIEFYERISGIHDLANETTYPPALRGTFPTISSVDWVGPRADQKEPATMP